jgi:hypothetical protein
VTSQHAGAAAAVPTSTLPLRPGTDPDRLAAAATALGWPGLALPGVRLLGSAMVPVLAVDLAAHERRRQAGCAAPMSDVDTLAVWEWPQAREACPPTATRLLGVLVPAGRSWAAAAATARRWAGFGATAILLPTDEATELCRLECGYAGIAIAGTVPGADAGAVRLLQAGRPGRSEKARRRTLDRWVEEQLYGRLLIAGVLAV